MGIQIRPLRPYEVLRYRVDPRVVIKVVGTDGCDPKTELRWGDLLIRCEKSPIVDIADYMRGLARHRVGDVVTYTVWRRGQTVDLTAVLKAGEPRDKGSYLAMDACRYALYERYIRCFHRHDLERFDVATPGASARPR